MESAERAVKTRGMKYSPEPTRGSGLLNYAKADIRNPLRYSVKRFFYLCCIP